MNNEILINVTPQEKRVAIIQRGIVQELLIEREANRGIVGNIYPWFCHAVLAGYLWQQERGAQHPQDQCH